MSANKVRGNELIEKLLFPNTPPKVEKAYKTLARRANEKEYGLFEEDVVVLDTETTGLDFKKSQLIEIAAVRLRGPEIVDEFQTYVAIKGAIPREIKQLTGIQDIDLVGAPNATEAVSLLKDFVREAPVIAHNASFDRSFLENVQKIDYVSKLWIDSLTLSRIALPRLKSHKLGDLAAAFDCPEGTHRALDDVKALCSVWRILLCALSDVPADLLSKLARMHPNIEWEYRAIFEMLSQGQTTTNYSLLSARDELTKESGHIPRSDAIEHEQSAETLSKEKIEEAFSRDGLLSHIYPGFEPRTSQQRMAQEVRDAFESCTHRAIEAGTGVGKSMAYLVPAVMFARENNLTVGVATKTNALSDQLINQELPKLNDEISGGINYMNLKGFSHYPCMRKLERAYTAELPISQTSHYAKSERAVASDMLSAIAIASIHAIQSYDGDIDSLGIRPSVPRTMLTTSSAECLRSRCPFFPAKCMVHGARRRAASADVFVTNHSLLLSNVTAEGNILPPVRYWIVDEAHSLEEEARKQWAIILSHEDGFNKLELLGNQKHGLISATMRALAKEEDRTLTEAILTKLAAAVGRARTSLNELFERSKELLAFTDTGSYEVTTLWINEKTRMSAAFGELVEQAQELQIELQHIVDDISDIVSLIGDRYPQQAAALTESLRAMTELANALSLIMSADDTSYVYSATLNKSSDKQFVGSFNAEKFDIGSEMAERWLPEVKSAVFCSATIANNNDFSRFEHTLGLDLLDDEKYLCVSLPSSFDYDYQMQALIVNDLPAPTERGYLLALEELLFEIHRDMGGSVLTLFTNRREMDSLWQKLQPRLKAEGLELLCQQRTGSTHQIARRFVSEKSSSLFALKSFWEGFDAAGDTLRCVVIPKLPFASPNDPIVKERDFREERSWWRYSLPDAVLSVKQAAGRLIRNSSDKGIVVLCDSRLVSKRYGKSFINALPTSSCHLISQNNIAGFIEMWRRSRE